MEVTTRLRELAQLQEQVHRLLDPVYAELERTYPRLSVVHRREPFVDGDFVCVPVRADGQYHVFRLPAALIDQPERLVGWFRGQQELASLVGDRATARLLASWAVE